jgi:energy-converting hydrogenase Eha subunit E
MADHQVVGAILVVVGAIDTAIGHLFVAPRVPDEAKRNLIKVAFSASGVVLVGLGLAFYLGAIALD